MNREEIVALAEKAGFERLFPSNEDWVCFTEEIERFYKMVVAAEREALAKDSSVTQQPDTSGTRPWFTVDELNAWADKYEAKQQEKSA